MILDNAVVSWLLEEDNPAVRYRTLTELVGLPKTCSQAAQTKEQVLSWLPQASDRTWMNTTKGLWLRYNLLAIAECGLVKEDIDITPALSLLADGAFDAACGDALLLRAFVGLGLVDDPMVRSWLDGYARHALPDGGFLCLHRLQKLKYMPKSCIKDNMHILLMLAQCKKLGVEFDYTESLLSYFLDRKVFYKSNSTSKLVLDCREGWRMTDNFFPCEVMRVGLPQLLYAFAVLGVGNEVELSDAWELLDAKKDAYGRYLLEGTLARSYLPKEKIGHPGKWVTLYSLLALKYK